MHIMEGSVRYEEEANKALELELVYSMGLSDEVSPELRMKALTVFVTDVLRWSEGSKEAISGPDKQRILLEYSCCFRVSGAYGRIR